jgi:hypothetical protein
MEENFSAPSILIRVDYVLHDNVIYPYEVEERPAGLGVIFHFHTCVYGLIAETFNKLDVGILLSKKREEMGSDDPFQTKVQVFREGEQFKSSLVYPRVHRDESQFFNLSQRSVSTLEKEGDKSYGVSIGLWREIPPKSERTLEWFENLRSESFAIKFKAGSRFDGVQIWTPQKQRGRETWTKICSSIEDGRAAYIQPFHPHESGYEFLPEGFSLFRRTYLIFNTQQNEYITIGGLWMAVLGLRGHGTPDAIIGRMSL